MEVKAKRNAKRNRTLSEMIKPPVVSATFYFFTGMKLSATSGMEVKAKRNAKRNRTLSEMIKPPVVSATFYFFTGMKLSATNKV